MITSVQVGLPVKTASMGIFRNAPSSSAQWFHVGLIISLPELKPAMQLAHSRSTAGHPAEVR